MKARFFSILLRGPRLPALALVIVGALLLSIVGPWTSEFRDQIKGKNTAPLYIRISGAPETISNSDLASHFLADSTATGNPASPELVLADGLDSGQRIIRWRWVLISNLRVSLQLQNTDFGVAGITLEYAYDSTCNNESDELPASLVWRRLSLPDHSSTAKAIELGVPPLNESLVPHLSIREALNWGGDIRAITQSLLAAQLPWSLYLLVACLCAGTWLISAIRAKPDGKPKIPGSETAATRRLREYWHSLLIFSTFVLLVVFATPVYDVNDDQRMVAMLAGHWQLPAGPRALFMSVTLGWPLHVLYSIAPTVPWYGIMLEVGLLGALFVVALAGTRFVSPLGHGIGLTLFLVFVGFLPAVRPTFSLVSAIACTAATFGLLSLVFRTAPGKRYIVGVLTVSVLLALFSTFLRLGAFAITAVVLSPALLLILRRLQVGDSRDLTRSVIGALAIAAILVVTERVVEHATYSATPAWSDWKEENRILAKALDWNKPANYMDETEAVFLSSSEQKMISHYFLLDSHLAAPATIAKLARQAEGSGDGIQASLARLYEDANQIVKEMPYVDPAYGNPLMLAIFITISALLALLFEQDHRVRALPLMALLWSLALIATLSLLTKPVPYRISYGMLFPAGVIAALALARLVDQLRQSTRASAISVSAILIVLAVPAMFHHASEVPIRRERSVELREEMQALAVSGSRDVVLHYLPSYAFPVLARHPQFAPARVHDTGYLATTPVATHARRESGFSDLPDLLKKRDRVLFLAANPDHTIFGRGASPDDLQSYLSERLDGNIVVSVAQQNYHWAWLKLSAIPPETSQGYE